MNTIQFVEELLWGLDDFVRFHHFGYIEEVCEFDLSLLIKRLLAHPNNTYFLSEMVSWFGFYELGIKEDGRVFRGEFDTPIDALEEWLRVQEHLEDLYVAASETEALYDLWGDLLVPMATPEDLSFNDLTLDALDILEGLTKEEDFEEWLVWLQKGLTAMHNSGNIAEDYTCPEFVKKLEAVRKNGIEHELTTYALRKAMKAVRNYPLEVL